MPGGRLGSPGPTPKLPLTSSQLLTLLIHLETKNGLHAWRGYWRSINYPRLVTKLPGGPECRRVEDGVARLHYNRIRYPTVDVDVEAHEYSAFKPKIDCPYRILRFYTNKAHKGRISPDRHLGAPAVPRFRLLCCGDRRIADRHLGWQHGYATGNRERPRNRWRSVTGAQGLRRRGSSTDLKVVGIRCVPGINTVSPVLINCCISSNKPAVTMTPGGVQAM